MTNPLGAIVSIIIIFILGAVIGAAGVYSYEAKKVATANATIQQMKEVQRDRDVKAEIEKLRLMDARATADLRWRAASNALRDHPVTVRVRDCASNGQGGGLSSSASVAGLNASLQVEELRPSSHLSTAIEISAAECAKRIEWAIEDAAVIEHLKVFIEDQRGSDGNTQE